MIKHLFFSTIIVLLSLCFASCEDESKSAKKKVWVKCDTVRLASKKGSLKFPAHLNAAEEVKLAFKVSGTLEKIYVEEGKSFRQGQLLAQIDPRDYQVQYNAVESEYLSVKADAERAFALYADSVITTAVYDKARYGLKQITAKFENAKNQLAYTKIYAPFDGTVKRTYLDPPAIVGAGTPVLSLYSSLMPEVVIHIPTTIYQRRNEIKSFRAKFDFLEEDTPLTLISISPSANANQLYTLRLALPSSIKERPTVGMSAMVEISFYDEEEKTRLSIPANAIFHTGGNDYVWIFKDDKAQKRQVETESLHTDGSAIITSGVKAGELIISAGVHSLHDGQEVKILPAASKTNTGGIL